VPSRSRRRHRHLLLTVLLLTLKSPPPPPLPFLVRILVAISLDAHRGTRWPSRDTAAREVKKEEDTTDLDLGRGGDGDVGVRHSWWVRDGERTPVVGWVGMTATMEELGGSPSL
jgi:hypothetical protein